MTLRTLGGLNLEGSNFTRPKPLLLVAYLAIEGPQEKRHLAELFWVGSAEPHANLRVTLMRLRKAAPSLIAVNGAMVSTTVPTDAQRLLTTLADGRLDVALYRGPFLQGVALDGLGVELEEWVYRIRELVAARVREALVRLGESDAAASNFDAAAQLARRAYFLPGAPEPDPESFGRIHRLLVAADSDLAPDVRKEAEVFGVSLDGDREAARRQIAAESSVPAESGECPYKGLAPFREEDAHLFFGRDAAVRDLAAAVTSQPFTALVGGSGSGKSSLVFAGLLPRLRRDAGWTIATLRPGRRPFLALATAVTPLLEPGPGEVERLATANRLAEGLLTGELSFGQVAERMLAVQRTSRLLLVLDQFEELYTVGEAHDSVDFDPRAFLDLLHDMVELPDRPVHALIALRSDFLASALAYRPMADLLNAGQILLGPMHEDEIRGAIEEPARLHGVRFEHGLVERIYGDIARSEESLPVIEFALSELWARQRTGLLTHQAYDDMGGVEEALATHADAILRTLDGEECEAAQQVLLQLVHCGDGQDDTRRVATRQELGERLWSVAMKLAAARLVVADRNESGDETAELIHEALIRKWDSLRSWVEENRSLRIWQDRIRQEVRVWTSGGQDDAVLLRGYYLEEARQRLDLHRAHLSPGERAFIEASIAQDEREQAEKSARQQQILDLERGRSRQLRSLSVVLAGLFVIAALAAGVAVAQWLQARANAALAVRNSASSLAGLSQASLPAEPVLSLKLALAAWPRSVSDPYPRTGAALAALRNAMRAFNEAVLLQGHEARLWSVAFSPSGETAVTASSDGTARIWDVATGTELVALTGHSSPVRSADLSPDGRVVVTASQDGTARLWDAATGTELMVLRGHENWVVDAEFSFDGSRVVTASFDGTARLWDSTDGSGIRVLRGHHGYVQSAAFSLNGDRVVTSSVDSTARIWDVGTGREVASLEGHEDLLNGAEFSPDGLHVVTASKDRTTRVWDAVTGEEVAALRGHGAEVRAAAFSPDGTRVVTASADATTRIWDVANWSELAVLTGHVAPVVGVQFSPDGMLVATASEDRTAMLWSADVGGSIRLKGHLDVLTAGDFSPDDNRIATASADGTVRVWDAASGMELAELVGHEGPLTSVSHSQDGTQLLTSSEDATARIWDVETGLEVGLLLGHHDEVSSAAFSPDGSRVVTASLDETARLWDASTGAELLALIGHEGPVKGVAFSSDGQLVATGSDDGTARLWDATTGAAIRTFQGHQSWVVDVVFSPDDERLATSSYDGTARIWDTHSGAEIAVLRGHYGWVFSVSFSADASRLVTGSADSTARLWDAATGAEVALLRGHGNWVTDASFSAKGSSVLTASYDGTARLWDVANTQGSSVFDIACSRLPDFDLGDATERFGVAIDRPICNGIPPLPERQLAP